MPPPVRPVGPLEAPPAKAFDWERFVILAMIGGGVLLLVAPFYVLYFRLVQRIIP